MKQPKPMVGQTWHCSANEVDVIAMHFIKNGNMEWSDGENSDLEWTHKFMTFIPQNDLEWLAVNRSRYPTSTIYSGDIYVKVYMSTGNIQTTGFSPDSGLNDGYDICREQWQSERYRLGLDTKPHYKLINGQWSETK